MDISNKAHEAYICPRCGVKTDYYADTPEQLKAYVGRVKGRCCAHLKHPMPMPVEMFKIGEIKKPKPRSFWVER